MKNTKPLFTPPANFFALVEKAREEAHKFFPDGRSCACADWHSAKAKVLHFQCRGFPKLASALKIIVLFFCSNALFSLFFHDMAVINICAGLFAYWGVVAPCNRRAKKLEEKASAEAHPFANMFRYDWLLHSALSSAVEKSRQDFHDRLNRLLSLAEAFEGAKPLADTRKLINRVRARMGHCRKSVEAFHEGLFDRAGNIKRCLLEFNVLQSGGLAISTKSGLPLDVEEDVHTMACAIYYEIHDARHLAEGIIAESGAHKRKPVLASIGRAVEKLSVFRLSRRTEKRIHTNLLFIKTRR